MVPCVLGIEWDLLKARKAARIMKGMHGRGAPSKEVIDLANQILAGAVEVAPAVISQVEVAASTSTRGPFTPPPTLQRRRAREVEEETSEEEEETTEEGDDYPGNGGDDGDGGEASKGEFVYVCAHYV